jgi:hypothetical protein
MISGVSLIGMSVFFATTTLTHLCSRASITAGGKGVRGKGRSSCPRLGSQRRGARSALRIAVGWIDQHSAVREGLLA